MKSNIGDSGSHIEESGSNIGESGSDIGDSGSNIGESVSDIGESWSNTGDSGSQIWDSVNNIWDSEKGERERKLFSSNVKKFVLAHLLACVEITEFRTSYLTKKCSFLKLLNSEKEIFYAFLADLDR